ncbi:MAG: NUDIX domain-containing protein, partial [Lentisphaeria bacterium]|nr:NUDIX domain-containing protein [Lentisphaeria bacterium]
ERFDIYDEAGNRIGTAPRRECHGNPKLLHHTAHVVVFHPETGAILLQKRSMAKDIQPGKWDTAVGGHLALGEDYEAGARRELAEELGVTAEVELAWLFDSKIRNAIESEDVRVFALRQAAGFTFQTSEIDAIRFWTANELFDAENRRGFTPNLCAELDELRQRGLI